MTYTVSSGTLNLTQLNSYSSHILHHDKLNLLLEKTKPNVAQLAYFWAEQSTHVQFMTIACVCVSACLCVCLCVCVSVNVFLALTEEANT